MLINNTILKEIQTIIAQARDNAYKAVDTQRVIMYWHIGKTIFEEEQQGKNPKMY